MNVGVVLSAAFIVALCGMSFYQAVYFAGKRIRSLVWVWTVVGVVQVTMLLWLASL